MLKFAFVFMLYLHDVWHTSKMVSILKKYT